MSMDNLLGDDDDLLGDGDLDQKPAWEPGMRGRPPKGADRSLKTENIHEITGGVSIPWMMGSFRMGRAKVVKLLQDGNVRPIGTHRNGGAYYDLPEAASCLVTPKQDFKAFLKTLKPSDLPINMQENYWAAKLKEQKFRMQAGDLWATPAVMQVFGDTFKMIKSKVQLWPDTIVESVGMNDEQREIMHQLMNDLLNDLAKELMDDATINETRSQLAEIDETPNS
jgi:hypothetical protein